MMNSQFSITLYVSTEIWNPQNCWYPYKVTATTEDVLRDVVRFDHVFVKFKRNRRNNKNFEYADYLVLDCDNDHSDLREDWIWPGDLSDLMPGVTYVTYSSRNDNEPKGDKSPRPRFHAIFPIDRVTDAEEYASLKRKTADLFPFFDHNALDAGRFFFGTDASQIEYETGEMNLTRFLALQDQISDDPNPAPEQTEPSAEKGNLIPEGERNTTLSVKAAKLLKRWGDTDEARRRFEDAASLCVPPLPDNELSQIWKSALKFYRKISSVPGYVPPAEYGHQSELPAAPAAQQWEEPIPLVDEKLPVFPVDSLPKTMGDYVLALSESLQTAVDMPAACALGVLSVCLQKKYNVRIRSDWAEPINLYSLVIAEPSEKKSPCLRHMIQPITRYEAEWNKTHKEDIEISQRKSRALRKRADDAERAYSNGKISEEQMRTAAREADDYPALDYLRIFVDDVTPEALTSHLAANRGTCSIMSAEGGIFETFAGRYSGSANIDTALKAYPGDPIRVDREGRPSETISDPAMTILMMIQPDVLSSVMGNSAFRGRGLTARFLYSLPESRVGSRNVNPASVPPEVRKAYEDFVLELLQEELPDTPEEITLSEEAEQARITFAEDLERRLLGDLTDIRDWAGKLEGNTMRIAGLICRAEAGPDGRIQPGNPEEDPHYEITGRQMFNAIRIANYYVEHTKAAYRKMGIEMLTSRCQRALAVIKKQHLETLKLRELMRNCRFLTTADEAQKVLDHLEEYAYIAIRDPETRRKPGRPGNPIYDVNPLVFQEN